MSELHPEFVQGYGEGFNAGRAWQGALSEMRHGERVTELLNHNNDQLEENRAQRRLISSLTSKLYHAREILNNADAADSYADFIGTIDDFLALKPFDMGDEEFQELTDEFAKGVATTLLTQYAAVLGGMLQPSIAHEHNILADHLRTWLRDNFGL